MSLVTTRGGALILLLLLATIATPAKVVVVDEDTIIYDDYTPGMGNSASAKQVADQVAYGVISCVTVGVLLIMLYMCIFGQRIRATAVRWHVLNCSLWGILHLISYCSFAEKAPWPNYITNQNWRDTAKQVECFTRSVFPAGMVFVYFEQIILTIAPKLANSWIFNGIFFVLLIPFLNGLMIFLYCAHFMDVVWWYEPIDLFNLATYLLFVTFTFIYFLFCLFGTCLCCATMTSKKPSSRTTGTFADMWLLFPYGVVPSIMYGPSFGMTSVSFAMQHLLTWVLESGLLTGGGGSGSSGGSLIDMNFMMQVATNAILAMPWFVLLFPLVQSVLALVCLRMFREQFFFMISCGRFFEGKRVKIGMTKDEWNVTSIGPPPIYPSSPCIVPMPLPDLDDEVHIENQMENLEGLGGGEERENDLFPPAAPAPAAVPFFDENHLRQRILEIQQELNRWEMVGGFVMPAAEQADGVEEILVEEEEEEEGIHEALLGEMEEVEIVEEIDWTTLVKTTKECKKPFSTDWFGDDRESLSDLAKFYKSEQFSDVLLKVGEESYPAHRLILSKSSDVFDRMLSQRWNGDKMEVELVEDSICQIAFSSFLRFLYCNHVVLHRDNCLPLLVLADKYNVTTLKKVCLDFAQSEILPVIDLKEIFSVWFSYATKAYHPSLIKSCMEAIAMDFETLLTEEWEKDWQELHRDQMVEILKCNELQLSKEFKLWEALHKWTQAPGHTERRGDLALPLMTLLIPLIRFPYMTADELSQVEATVSKMAKSLVQIFQPPLLLAYKFQALPLSSRMNSDDFCKKQFLLRRYRDIRWDRRINVSKNLLSVPCVDHAFTFDTRSSTFPYSEWKWTLKLTGLSVPNPAKKDVLRILLIAEGMDQSRSIEYLLQIVDDKKVLFSTSGKKSFTKTRYYSELEMEKKIEFDELLSDESPYSYNREFIFQVLLRSID